MISCCLFSPFSLAHQHMTKDGDGWWQEIRILQDSLEGDSSAGLYVTFDDNYCRYMCVYIYDICIF